MSRSTANLVRLACALFLGAVSGVHATETSTPVTGATLAPLTRENFLSSLSRDLAGHFNLEGQLDLELLRPWAPPAQVATTWNVTVNEYPAVASSAMFIHCRIAADGQVVSEQSLVLRAALWRDAWVTKAPLSIGNIFDPSLLETRRVDLFRDREALPAAVGDRTYIFARGVPAGYLLTWRDVVRRPLVKKGDMVEVSAAEGPLVITMKALAMQNGGQGEIVTVRNPESRRDFSALVVDENRVQVRF